MKTKLEYFALFSADCMSCKHLCPETGTKAYSKCHYSKGNTQCPASEVQFSIVGEAHAVALQVLSARSKRWPKKEARLMRYVAAQSTAFRTKFYEHLENPSS